MNPQPRWQGIFPAITTKFHADESIDADGTARHIDFQIRNGIHGLVTCGSLGEASTLSLEEKLQVAKIALEAADGRVPVLANVSETSTRDALRYIDIDKAFYQGFFDSLSANNSLSHDFLTHRFELYHAANYRAHQSMQRLVEELSALLPLTTADLLEDGPVSSLNAPSAEPVPAAPAAPTPAVATPSFVSPPVPAATETAPLTAAPLAPPAPVAHAPAQPMYDNEAVSMPLHEKLRASQPTAPALADTLRSTATPASLAERGGPKVETLREAISINQRFSFINELFNGENMDYHAAIQHLDSLPTAEQARAYVSGDLSLRYDWSRKEEHINKLLKLIERKFA